MEYFINNIFYLITFYLNLQMILFRFKLFKLMVIINYFLESQSVLFLVIWMIFGVYICVYQKIRKNCIYKNYN